MKFKKVDRRGSNGRSRRVTGYVRVVTVRSGGGHTRGTVSLGQDRVPGYRDV